MPSCVKSPLSLRMDNILLHKASTFQATGGNRAVWLGEQISPSPCLQLFPVETEKAYCQSMQPLSAPHEGSTTSSLSEVFRRRLDASRGNVMAK